MQRSLVSTCFVFLCCLSPVPVIALTIELDPGLPGETFHFKTFDITADLNTAGVVADGSTLPLDFEFIDMRHLEFQLLPPGTSFPSTGMAAAININWAGGIMDEIVDDPDASLTDPMSPPRFPSNDVATAHGFSFSRETDWSANWTFNDYPDLVQFHGLQKTITLATGTSGTPTVESASLFLNMVPIDLTGLQFEVGVWVPEPTTSTLALAALCLAMSRRRI